MKDRCLLSGTSSVFISFFLVYNAISIIYQDLINPYLGRIIKVTEAKWHDGSETLHKLANTS